MTELGVPVPARDCGILPQRVGKRSLPLETETPLRHDGHAGNLERVNQLHCGKMPQPRRTAATQDEVATLHSLGARPSS